MSLMDLGGKEKGGTGYHGGKGVGRERRKDLGLKIQRLKVK